MTWATETAPAWDMEWLKPQKTVSVSIVVPAFNEAGNIDAAFRGVLDAVRAAGLLGFHEVILVDDGSTDDTGRLMDAIAERYLSVRVIHHPANLGLRAAYETGLAAARKEYVTWVPGDGEMATDSIANILSAVGSADLVVPYHGTPERRTWFRRLLTWGSTTQLNWLLGHSLQYFQGTVVYPTEMARRLPRTVPGFFCMAEMLAHALDEEPTYVQVHMTFVERTYGVSKAISWRAIWNAQKHIVRLWWRLRIKTACAALGFALEYR